MHSSPSSHCTKRCMPAQPDCISAADSPIHTISSANGSAKRPTGSRHISAFQPAVKKPVRQQRANDQHAHQRHIRAPEQCAERRVGRHGTRAHIDAARQPRRQRNRRARQPRRPRRPLRRTTLKPRLTVPRELYAVPLHSERPSQSGATNRSRARASRPGSPIAHPATPNSGWSGSRRSARARNTGALHGSGSATEHGSSR
jgi:hypothetical protein